MKIRYLLLMTLLAAFIFAYSLKVLSDDINEKIEFHKPQCQKLGYDTAKWDSEYMVITCHNYTAEELDHMKRLKAIEDAKIK